MKWPTNRFLALSHAIVLMALIVVGCTSKQEATELLSVCGNHSCGELIMVTSDTSSDGFHYLNPSLSPDGTRILFTADWKAFPSADHYEEDNFYTNFRQMIVMPVRQSFEPEGSLAKQGAELIKLRERNLPGIGGQGEQLATILDDRKGGPIWLDDTNIIFYLGISRGFRLFRADISNPDVCNVSPLFLEDDDLAASGDFFQHMEPALSPDGHWLAFTRSSCEIPDSFETCTGLELMVLQMSTAGANNGYDAVAFPVTGEYSRVEKPSWSPDGHQIVFAGGMDLAGQTGTGTELFTIDFDTTGLALGAVAMDNNLLRLTYTEYTDGDPISSILNTSPKYSADGSEIYFVSTRRAPTTTLHDRNIWVIPDDGSLDPEIYFFTRSDDVDPSVNPDGSLLLSSQVGFTTELLDDLEEEAYQMVKQFNDQFALGLTELEMRNYAAGQRQQLAFFEGVMSHLYIYRP